LIDDKARLGAPLYKAPMWTVPNPLIDITEMLGRILFFSDRKHAGEVRNV
jgi:hypothetical protein